MVVAAAGEQAAFMDAEQVARNDAVSARRTRELKLDDYERIRSDPTQFVVRPGHDAPDVETVIERHESYWVVRKHEGDPAGLARRTDELT
jgi:hypothetical protein